MKKFLLSIALLSVFVGTTFAYEQEFIDAHKWMYVSEMTKFATIAEFQPESLVTREQAAKFFVAFDRVVMWRDAETLMYCVYSDETTFDTILAGSIQSACNRNLMRGANGVFGATEYLTKAQALTILIRSIQSDKLDETVTPRWKNYFVAAQEAKLTKETNVYAVDKPLTRYELALLLWRVQNPLPEVQDDMSTIIWVLQELWLQEE
jgi:hypothetical protein